MAGPTILLLHGAFADASCWRHVFDDLDQAGHAVVAPPNPLRGLTSDAAYIEAVVDAIDGPVLLVGHSYAGAVISVAGDSEKVLGLVYVAGFVPDVGESLNAMQARFEAPPLGECIRPAQIPGGVELSVDPKQFHRVLAADITATQANFMAVSQRPVAPAAFAEPAPSAAWHTKSSWAVLPTHDLAINPELQKFAYERAGAVVSQAAEASHLVMLSEPKTVARVIRNALGT
jgi:pimeloyl-ACP methyl ester carboxylesterase